MGKIERRNSSKNLKNWRHKVRMAKISLKKLREKNVPTKWEKNFGDDWG